FSDPHGIGLIAIFFPLLTGGLNRGVNGVKGQISKKGSVFIGLNKRARFFSQLFWQTHPPFVGIVFHLRIIERRKIASAVRSSGFITPFVNIESVVFRIGSLVSQMPFSGKKSLISGLFHRFRQYHILMRKVMDVFWR